MHARTRTHTSAFYLHLVDVFTQARTRLCRCAHTQTDTRAHDAHMSAQKREKLWCHTPSLANARIAPVGRKHTHTHTHTCTHTHRRARAPHRTAPHTQKPQPCLTYARLRSGLKFQATRTTTPSSSSRRRGNEGEEGMELPGVVRQNVVSVSSWSSRRHYGRAGAAIRTQFQRLALKLHSFCRTTYSA
jgi:hypothetical protein